MNNFMYIFSLGISNNSIYVIPLGVPNCKSMLLRIAELCLERLLSYYLRYNHSVYKLYNPALTKFSFFTFFFFFFLGNGRTAFMVYHILNIKSSRLGFNT